MSTRANLRDLLTDAIEATIKNERAMILYDGARYSRGLPYRPYERVCAMVIDAVHIPTPRTQDQNLLKRSYSTKINHNALVKIRVSDVEGRHLGII